MHKQDIILKVKKRDGKFKPVATIAQDDTMGTSDVDTLVMEAKFAEVKRCREAGLAPPVFEVEKKPNPDYSKKSSAA